MTFFPGVHTRGMVASRSEIEATCFADVRIDQEPTRPEPPVTPEEQALIDRRNAEAAARDTYARWRAVPAAEGEDRQARDALADFMRDQVFRERRVSEDPVEEAIGAMSEAELRASVRGLASGNYWSIGRELCEAAVREPDPVAALARLAEAQLLDPLAMRLVHYQCFARLEGRHRGQRPESGVPARRTRGER